jgi:hypothetical protein
VRLTGDESVTPRGEGASSIVTTRRKGADLRVGDALSPEGEKARSYPAPPRFPETWVIIALAVVLWIASAPPAQAESTIALEGPSPGAAQAGVQSISLRGSKFPGGKIVAADVTVKLEPARAGRGPTATTPASAVTTLVGTSRQVTFKVPPSLSVTTPTAYLVSITGATSTGAKFSTRDKVPLTINPPPRILSLTPDVVARGVTASVTITGEFTDFEQGVTRASFGPGTSVAGGAEGDFGLVTVTSPTSAVTRVTVTPSASGGFRSPTVRTGAQEAALDDGFRVEVPSPPGRAATGTTGGRSEDGLRWDVRGERRERGERRDDRDDRRERHGDRDHDDDDRDHRGKHREELTVVKAGTAAGVVTSSPSGIDCGATCMASFVEDTLVTLTATPAVGAVFGGWSGGGCYGTGPCVIKLKTATTVTATFAPLPITTFALTVGRAGAGGGTVASSPAGIDCGAACAASFASGTVVTLTATPAGGSVFTGWSGGGCSGTGACTTTLTAATTVTATFAPLPVPTFVLTVSRAGTGIGTVTSDVSGIDCGSICTASVVDGTVVTLTAAPAGGSVFAGWSGGGCAGTGPCAITVTAATTVTATFAPVPVAVFALTVGRVGAGGGTVTSSPTGIDCGVACGASYVSGTTVTLTATAAPGAVFTGWSGGGCSGAGSCVLTVSAATAVTATFAPLFTLNASTAGAGSGTVSSSPAGIACGATCAAGFTSGTVVTLTATPDASSVFAGWSGGGCSGTGPCVIALSAAATATATFTPVYALSVAKTGTGTGGVTSTPAGVACGATCTASFTSGAVVTLTATPTAGSVFAGWSGAGCSGTDPCVLTLGAARAVTASFTANRAPTAVPGGPYTGTAGGPIAFSGSASSDPDKDPLGFSWDFGDGSLGTGVTPTHSYASAGVFTVTLTVTDGRGGASTATTTATVQVVDTLAPVISLSGPGQILPGAQATITAQASDNVGVASVTFEVDGGSRSVVTTPPYQRIVTAPAVAAVGSAIRVKATAADGAGNTASVELVLQIALQPDTTPPTVSVKAPAQAAPGTTLQLSATASDDVGVASVTFLVGGVPIVTSSGPAYLASYLIPSDAPVGSVLRVTARAADFAGNTAESAADVAVAATADTTPPTVQLTIPATVIEGGTLRFSAAASDDSGVASVSFLVAGALVATRAAPPYEAQFALPPALRAGATFGVEARATDFAGNQASAAAQISVIVATAAGRGVVAGVVYDDTTGLPLENATAQLIALDGAPPATPPQALTDARGRFRLSSVPGSATIRIFKAGFTESQRVVAVVDGRRTDPFDARLTPLDARQSPIQSVTGGAASSQAGDASLGVAAGALASDQSLRLTILSAQGLLARLPSGWSPLIAVDIAPGGVSLGAPASLSLRAPGGLGQGPPLALARWDAGAGAWVVAGDAGLSPDGTTLVASLPQTGQYAVLVGDAAPNAPPAPVVGQGLPAVLANPPPATVSVFITPSPKILFAQPGALSRVGVVAVPSAPMPSGSTFRLDLAETFNLVSGARLFPDPTGQDLVLYTVGAGTPLPLTSDFSVSPSRAFSLTTLQGGVIDLAVSMPVDRGAARGTVIGAAGGIASTADARLSIPAGAAAEDLPVVLSSLAAPQFRAPVPAGLTFLTGVQVDLHGGQLSGAATLSVPAPAGLAPDARVLVVQLREVDGVSDVVLIGVGALQGGLLTAATDPFSDGSLLLPGVSGEGRYAFLRADVPLGFIAGVVTGADGQPLGGGLVTPDSLAIVALARSDGRYALAVPLGDLHVTAVDRTTGDTTTAPAHLATPGGVSNLALGVAVTPPTVLGIVPAAAARNVPLGSPVTVTFSEPLDPGSVGAGALLLTKGGVTVGGTLSLSTAGTVVTFRPDALLESAGTYQVTVAGAVRDLAGNPMGAPVVSQFTTVNVTPPPPPPAGAVTATIPDVSGASTVSGTQGTAVPGGRVEVKNLATGAITTLAPNADGSFSGLVPASPSDKLALTIRDADGNATTVLVPAFRNADGSVVVGAAGGAVQGAGGVRVDVPAGALPDGTVVKVDPLADVDLPLASPANFQFVGGVRLSLGGAQASAPLSLSVAAPADAALDDQVLVGLVVQLPQRLAWTVVDRAHLDGGSYRDADFGGVLAEGSYAFLRTTQIITPGANGHLDSTPAGDDQIEARPQFANVVGNPMGNVIASGANGTLETIPAGDDVLQKDCVSYVRVAYQFRVDVVLVGLGMPFVFPSTSAQVATMLAICNSTLEIQVQDPGTGDVIQKINQLAAAVKDQVVAAAGTLTDDHTPPLIVGTNNPTGQNVNQIEVRFSEAMNPTSVKNGLVVKDSAGKTLTGVVDVRQNGTLGIFTPNPNTPLLLGEKYTVTLASATDVAGNQLQAQPIVFTPFSPSDLSAFRDIASLRDALAKCSGAACAPGLAADCIGAGCTTSVTDVALIGSTLFVANGATLADQQYRDAASEPKRLLAVDVTNPAQPIVLGFSATETNPRALAAVENASFTLPAGGIFQGNLLVVAGGGRVAGGELAGKVEVYDVGLCTRRPINTALNCLEGALKGAKLLSTPNGLPPQPGIPPDSGVPLQIAVLHDQLQQGPAADRVLAYVVTAGIGLQAVDVVQAFATNVPEGLLRGDFLDVGVVKNKVIAVKTDSSSNPVVSMLTAGLGQITDIPPPVGLSKLPAVARVAVGENMFFDLNGNGTADVDATGVAVELFDLVVVSSGPLTVGCPTATVPCGEIYVADVSPLTLNHAGSPRIVARIPMPGPAFSMQVDPVAKLVYVEVRGVGLAIVDLSNLLIPLKSGTTAQGLGDLDNNGRDDRILRVIARTDIFQPRVRVDTTRGIAFINGATSGLDIFQVSNQCLDIALDFKGDPPQEKDLKQEKEILTRILNGAVVALKNVVPKPVLLEQGSGSCFWRSTFKDNPQGTCKSFQAGISDHDIEVYVPQFLVEQAQGILDAYLKSKPPGIEQLGDLSLFAVSRAPFETDQELLIGTPMNTAGSDPTGHLGMGLQTLLLLWLLEGEWVTGYEGKPLDAILAGLKAKPATSPVIPGEPSGIPRLEGLEFAMLQEFNFYNAGAMVRIKGGCDAAAPAQTVAPSRLSGVDVNDPSLNSDEVDALGQGCQAVLHSVGKAAIRATLGRLIADDRSNPLVLDINRESYQNGPACRTGVADPRNPPADPSGYTPKACGGFEEYIVSVAVKSVLAGQGVFTAADLPKIFTFYCIKVGAKCADRNGKPIDAPYFRDDTSANAFIAGALTFIQTVEGQAGAIYFQTLGFDTKAIGALPFLTQPNGGIANICAKLGFPISFTSPRSDLRSCNRQIVLAKINGDPSFTDVPTSAADRKKKLGARNFVVRNLQVRALNRSARVTQFTVRMYEGDGLSAAGYTAAGEYSLALAPGDARVLDVVEDPPGSGKIRPIFPREFDLTKLAPNQVRAIAFFADPDRRLPEADKTDNLAAYFYYVLDPSATAGPPSLPPTPVSPVKDMTPDPLCTDLPSLALTFAVQRMGDLPGPGGPELAVRLGDQVSFRYTVRNGGKQNLTDVQVFRQGNAAPVVTAGQIGSGVEQTGVSPDVVTPPVGTSVIRATAVGKDPKGNTVRSLPTFVTLNVTPPPCEAEIAPLSPDPNPTSGVGLPVSEVMQGGRGFRYYQVRRNGVPLQFVQVDVRITPPNGLVQTHTELTDSQGLITHVAAPGDDDPRGLKFDTATLGNGGAPAAPGDEILVEIPTVQGVASTCPQSFVVRVKDRTFTRAVKAGTNLELEVALALDVKGKAGFGLDFSVDGSLTKSTTLSLGRSANSEIGLGLALKGPTLDAELVGDWGVKSEVGFGASILLTLKDQHRFGLPLDASSTPALGLLLAETIVAGAVASSPIPGGPLLAFVVDRLAGTFANLDASLTSVGASLGIQLSAGATAKAELTAANTNIPGLSGFGAGIGTLGLSGKAMLVAGADYVPPSSGTPSEVRPAIEVRTAFDLKLALDQVIGGNPSPSPQDQHLSETLKGDLTHLVDLSGSLAGKMKFGAAIDTSTGKLTKISITVTGQTKFGFKLSDAALPDVSVNLGTGIVNTATYTITDPSKFAEAISTILTIRALVEAAVGPLDFAIFGPTFLGDQTMKLLKLADRYEQSVEKGDGITVPIGISAFLGGGLEGKVVLNADRSVSYVTERGAVKATTPNGKETFKVEQYPIDDPQHIAPLDGTVTAVLDQILAGAAQALAGTYKSLSVSVGKGVGAAKTFLQQFFSPSGVELLVDGAAEPDPATPLTVNLIAFPYRAVPGPAPSAIARPSDVAGSADAPHYGIGGFFQFTPEARVLAAPAQLTIHYLDTEVASLDASTLAIYAWNQDRLDWDFVGGTIDAIGHTVTANIGKLGLYTVAPVMPAGAITFTTQAFAGGSAQAPTTIVEYVSAPVRMNNGQLVPDGTVFTVRTLQPDSSRRIGLGTVVSPDVDPSTPETQVISQNGVVRFTAELPGAAGSALVLVNSTVGTALSQDVIPYARP